MPAGLASLPPGDDALFLKIWLEDRLRVGNPALPGDAFDEATARLVSAAVRARRSLVVLVPDAHPVRAPLLLATALLREFFDRHLSGVPDARRKRFVYFGTSVGIRDQLTAAMIEGIGGSLRLADVFVQRHLGRTTQSVTARTAAVAAIPLAEVVTVYAPANPALALEQEQPDWVALDVGARAPWAQTVVEECARRGVPLLGWTHDRLPEWLPGDDALRPAVFRWPRRATASTPPDRPQARLEPGILLRRETVNLEPWVLTDGVADTLAGWFAQAQEALLGARGESSTPFYADALRVHWRYLRALESLTVPFGLHEAEAPRFWGLSRVADLAAACERYGAGTASRPPLAALLNTARQAMDAAVDVLRDIDPPLWAAAREIAGSTGEEGTLLAFSSPARKQLFTFALLASRNWAEADLARRGVRLATFAELTRGVPSVSRVVCVGLPSAAAGGRPLALFEAPVVRILVYPHQRASLRARVRDWNTALSADGDGNAAAVEALGGSPEWIRTEARGVAIQTGPALRVSGGSAQEERSVVDPLPRLDAEAEVARLFEDPEDEDPQPDQMVDAGDERWAASASVVVEDAVRVRFSDGWTVELATDDRLAVLTGGSGRDLDERYVSALRPGDVVLAMPGQKRQNLYGLLVDRVHRHPAIQLHLALIQRWHDEFAEGYARASRQGRNMDDLLAQIRARGSRITSFVTLYAWLRGAILCPSDGQDLLRVAESLEMPFVREHHHRIHVAANRIRGLHRNLSTRIGRWMEDQLAGRYGADDDVVLDPEWGVRFADFRDSLVLLRITGTEPVVGPVLRSRLGHFTQETT
jgi:hypothetical protein